MTFDMRKVEESKKALGQRLAALPLEEKLQLLDAMRERALLFAASKPKSADTCEDKFSKE